MRGGDDVLGDLQSSASFSISSLPLRMDRLTPFTPSCEAASILPAHRKGAVEGCGQSGEEAPSSSNPANVYCDCGTTTSFKAVRDLLGSHERASLTGGQMLFPRHEKRPAESGRSAQEGFSEREARGSINGSKRRKKQVLELHSDDEEQFLQVR